MTGDPLFHVELLERRLVREDGSDVSFSSVTRRAIGLLGLLIWRLHRGVTDAMSVGELREALGVRNEDGIEQQRSGLRSLFGGSFDTYFLEPGDGPLKYRPLTLHRQLPSDLGDLLKHIRRGGAGLAEVDIAVERWEKTLRIRGAQRGPWFDELLEHLRQAHVRQTEPIARIPDPPPVLFGREAECEAVQDGLDMGKVVTLHGASRMGKSAIAATVATKRNVALWVEFGDPELPTSLPNVIAGSLGIDQGSDAQLKWVVEALNTLADGRPGSLLVLDDCPRDAGGDVRELRSAVTEDLDIIVTSPGPLGLVDLEVDVPIGGLEPKAGAALFYDTARRVLEKGRTAFDASDRREVPAVCAAQGGNPLLIKLAVTEHGGGVPLDELGRRSVHSEEFTERLAESLTRLSKRRRSVISRLSAFGGAFDLSMAARVLGESRAKLQPDVDALVGTYLLRAVRDGRVELRVEQSVRRVARDQLLDQRYADRVRGLMLEAVAFGESDSRLDWLKRVEAQAGNIAGVLNTALRGGRPMHPEVAQLALKMLPYWRMRGLYDDGLGYLDAVRERLGDDADPEVVSQLLSSSATLSYLLHGRDRAIELFGEALALAPQNGAARAVALYGGGYVCHDESRVEQALEAAPSDHEIIRADALRALGWNHYLRAEYPESRSRFEDAYEIARRLQEQRHVGEAALGLGWIERRLCRLKEADEAFTEAYALGNELGDKGLQAEACNGLGEVERARADAELAELWLEDGLGLARRGGVRWIEARLKGSRAERQRMSATTSGELREARDQLQESMRVAKEYGKRDQEAWRHFGVGVVSFLLRDLSNARKSFKASRDLAVKLDDRRQLARCDQQLGRITMLGQNPSEVDPQLQARATRRAVPLLITTAVIQDDLGVVDELAWTLQDLVFAHHRLGQPRKATMLAGALAQLRRSSELGDSEVLRSGPLDWYADDVEAAIAAMRRETPPNEWDWAVGEGESLVVRVAGRLRVQRMLDRLGADE